MVIDSIRNGIVIDHIKAGRGMTLLRYLDFDNEHDTVAIIMNATSERRGKKDIIKIENVRGTEVDMDIVGLIDPGATVNIIEDEIIKTKIRPSLPKKVVNVIKCRNPRCVTGSERGISHEFVLNSAEKQQYRCVYCDEIVSMQEE
ncbi:MAG: aspartate carbamoyltransferase regulatory subunit [Firmicutes bacterium]|nr:aspartate carbamoyltransferase regulatory subunit [Bacillota bacterium]